ncbi:MAG: ABC transporter permease [Gemmatimonadaceae bacterium]|nr:ABC transporter permease [Gloeobacterales cyanobacterium ES-bin-141]
MSNSFSQSTAPALPLGKPAGQSTAAEFRQETLALTRRLFIQLGRRPSTFLAGIIQPLMWLVLFGALFANVPRGTFGIEGDYIQFLAAGVIIFTAFGGALNAGVPLIFDREFGFLNRLLVAPLVSRFSIVLASTIFIFSLSLVQTAVILLTSFWMGANFAAGPEGLLVVALVVGLLVLGFAALSLGLAFAMPGHVELLAFILLVNLPLIFASTALAPLSFMPTWLQVVASLNPLTHAIEPIRFLYTHAEWSFLSPVLQAPWGSLNLTGCLAALVVFDALVIGLVGVVLKKKLS